MRAELDKADKVADWQEHRYDELPDSGVARGLRSNLRDIAPDDTVAVCIYSGTFVTPVGPPALDGMTKPPHDMLRLLVLADGTVTVDAAGYSKSGMKPETPDDWRPAG